MKKNLRYYQQYQSNLSTTLERSAKSGIYVARDHHEQQKVLTSHSPALLPTSRGRPKFDVSKDQLEYFKVYELHLD